MINNGSIAKKVLDDIRFDLTDEKTAVGITAMQSESNTTNIAEDHPTATFRTIDSPAHGSDEPFKPLNLTYSLFKEHPESRSGLRTGRLNLQDSAERG